MTQQELAKLSQEAYENFMNNGGVITEDLVSPETTAPSRREQLIEAPSEQPIQEQEPLMDQSSSVVLDPEVEQYIDGFDIQDPVELLYLLDDDIASGKVVLHKWQAQHMLDFASGGNSDKEPYQSLVRACNGSGKDKYIIAPEVVWLCMRYKRARGIVTSSSGVQLDNQTCAYISQLCESANRKWGKVWKVNYRNYLCLPTEAPVVCYATDEPGKAEGYHPLAYGAKMGIFASEDKTIPDEINVALNKCTGYTHRVHVSSPGLPMGHFYEMCSTAIRRDTLKSLKEAPSTNYVEYLVTAYQCSHLSMNYIEQMKRDLPGGENGPAFKSQVLAEFGMSDGDMVVLAYTFIWKAVRNTFPHIPESFNTAGLDLSRGGDELCLYVRNGNKVIAKIPFRFDNTEDSVAFLNQKFREYSLNNPQALIFADAGGLGAPIIDRLRGLGWTNMRYVLNQSKPYDTRIYSNRGAEIWFHFAKLCEKGELILINDEKTVTQLSQRHYKLVAGKAQLESKLQARAAGRNSPDRADALVLCFSNYKSKLADVLPEEKNLPFEAPTTTKPVPLFSVREWAKGDRKQSLRGFMSAGRRQDFSLIREELEENNKRIRERLKANG